ncbi:glucan biosynthesis protein [Thioflexithrix psekupsensis]|uniref:Glucans biosynthesis protein G n=1 Tax=Thioflexithrix psekupsensis TaxID=1570016 RepID=A0A251X7B2_9GAMM|nr:glucan biosynthesis protein G [Thioflexithrix psekupsensis]OUD13959.1 glucan biosynthesis protein D [Thioflexithrix psekupsensis]
MKLFILSIVLLGVFGGVADPIHARAVEAQTEEVAAPPRFDFPDVHRRAQELARESYSDQFTPLPEAFKNLDYDRYRHIRFIHEKALWYGENLPFLMRFFHRGFLFERPVNIHVIDEGEIIPVPYRAELFDYGDNQMPEQLSDDLGFAGFQLLYPLSSEKHYLEFAVFLGASYFRAVGRGQWYGLSVRGLAIDTGLPRGEEFPFFREFWVKKPKAEDTELTLYALLDSPSVTGAYRFILKPGLSTDIEVKASLFFRNKVQKLGIAPLTSMFFHGENTERYMDDFRPEVHDSDGLLMVSGQGEWLWRPLSNPHNLQIHSFLDENPKGFGLFQRDRDFNNYQDLEAFYHLRPSVWVEPLNDWGAGRVELVEIPTDAERHDNIVAYWVPKNSLEINKEYNFSYRLRFITDDSEIHPGGRAIATRTGGGGTDKLDTSKRKFVLEFTGKKLNTLPVDTPIQGIVSASSGQLSSIVVQKNNVTEGWRLFFELEPENNKPVELRAFLKSGYDILTETWSYQWQPNK